MSFNVELKPVPLGWLVALYAVIALSVVLLVAGWDRIPDPMPIHWGPRGEADSFDEKTPGAAFSLVAIGAIPLGVLTPLIVYGTHGLARSGSDRDKASANEMVPLVAEFMFGVTVIVVGGVTASLLGLRVSTPFILAAIALLLVWFVYEIRAAQRRIVAHVGESEIDRHLYWGMFYHNPDDERVLVENGMSTTMNFARPTAWLILAAVLAPVIIVIVVAVLGG